MVELKIIFYGKYVSENKKDVKNAFRNESNKGTKKKYFINNTIIKNNIRIGICNNCNKEIYNITIDYYKLSYKEIFDNFININNINLHNIKIFENKYKEIRLKDERLSSKWLYYHDNKAHYILLCRACNRYSDFY